MNTITMTHQKNIQLLKEYIKTLIATEVVFPGIMPRRWGHEFDRQELSAIYFGLKFVINKAHPLKDIDMIDAFDRIEESEPVSMHWFLYDYWEEVVSLLTHYPTLSNNYLSSLN